MRKNELGRFVCLGSDSGIFGADKSAMLGTVKGGLWGFIKAVALEGEKKNVRANLVFSV